MADPNAALLTQLSNIQKKAGKSLAELAAALAASGATKHGEKRRWLMQQFGLGYGDANSLVHVSANPPADLQGTVSNEPVQAQAATTDDDPLAAIYSGTKAPLRALHEATVARIAALGEFEIAPKKSYVSLRRKRQFAMLGPATRELLELGLNVKGFDAHPRLKLLPPGGMCQASVRFGSLDEVDGELLGWIKQAFDAAG